MAGYPAALDCLLLLVQLWSWFWSAWPGATRSSSWGAHLCGLICRCPPQHTLWMASCKLSEFSPRSNLQRFSHQIFLHGCFPSAWRTQIPLGPLLTCCWILIHAPWCGNVHFCRTVQSSRQHRRSNHGELGVQPSGTDDRLLCSRPCSSCSWSCYWDLCLVSTWDRYTN